MNANLLAVVNRIVAEQGENILADAKRLFPFFADYAKNEYKEERIAFGRCIEYGAYQELKRTRAADERQRVKATLADQINAKTGVDRKRCADALDLLEMVIFKTVQQSTQAPSQANRCSKCGKDLQKEWTACPYCSTPVVKAGMQTSWQESPKPGTPVYSNNTFSQTQQPVNLTTGCQGCLLNGGAKCKYYNCAISEAEKYDCGMRGSPELQKKQKNTNIISWIVLYSVWIIAVLIVWNDILEKLFGLELGVIILWFLLAALFVWLFYLSSTRYKKRRKNAKRL